MKSSCKSFEVFDFKEEDELSELTAAKYTSKFGNSNAIDKYTFLEDVAQGTNIQSNEIGKILCVDVDADNSDHNVDSAASISSPDTGENCATKRMSGIDAVLQINSTTPDQLPQFRPNKPELISFVSGVEGSSSPTSSSPTGSSPTSASPDNSKLKFTLLEAPCSDESIDVASNADGSMGERSPSTSSDIAEDDVPVDGRSSDHCFGGWEMGDGDMTVVFFPDYVVYRDRYCTDSVLTFSSSCIEIKGSTACGDQGTFVFQWGIDDIINIESQWCGRFEMAMVKIRVISKDAAQDKNVIDTSGIEELKFAVVDSDWYEKQEVITSFDVYKALWNTVLDSDTERDGEALLGQNGEFFSKHYFPDFDDPFEDVVYPKGDSDAVSISKRDVDLLQPDTFVNDTIIDFYIKYLKNKIQPDEWHRFHFFNSFFFRKLADLDKDPSSAFDARAAFQRVRKWTRKVNLFEKDYVFIPVNFNYHWSLLVICHPGEATTFQDEDIKGSLKVPCILHMDSIRGSHTGLKGLLQSYLWEEWKERQKETSEDMSSRFFNLRFVSLELPQQQNSFDCGLFLLHYAELFLEEAPVNFNPFKITKFSNFLNANWFQPAEASLKRVLIQRLIYDLLDNCSREISPNAGNDDHRTSNCPKYDGDNEMAVEFLSERSICSKAPGGNVPSSQAALGIEITLLPTSSLKSSQCASDSGLVLRELFGPEAGVRSLLDAQYQTFNQTAPFDEFKSTMSPIEQEEGEAGAHFVCSPLTETRLQQLGGITPEVCVFPSSSKDLRAEASWNPAISVHQAGNEDNDPSLETSISDSDSSIEIEENENGHVGSDFGLKEKMDQPISPSTEKTECVTECFASAPIEMMDADSVYSVQMLKGNDNAVSLTSCPKNLLGFPSEETDMRLISYDSGSESDVGRSAKKMRLTPPLEGEGGLTRSLSNDLHL